MRAEEVETVFKVLHSTGKCLRPPSLGQIRIQDLAKSKNQGKTQKLWTQKQLSKDRFKNEEIENRDDELGKKRTWTRALSWLPRRGVASFS